MSRSHSAAIRMIGSPKGYSDGAETVVSETLAAARDVSDGSDELRGQMSDWATTYHFSPIRSNILRPFKIESNMRVLEVGAGTGAVTRYLGERGASVIALEGDRARAEAAARRCDGLENVEVVCGALSDLEDPKGFDLVVVIGVLEYAGGRTPDDGAQIEFLQHAVNLLRPSGALVLAIENQLGLKYLLGYAEDHLGEPWVGIEDYPGNPPVRTTSRRALQWLLERSGVPAQQWFSPFPDYKLPTTILTEELYDRDHHVEVIDQLVGNPILDLANPPSRFCDDRASHRVFLDAGLGFEVTNSFLVLAGRDRDSIGALVDESTLAWHFSSNRRRSLRRVQTVNRMSTGLRVRSALVFGESGGIAGSWLAHAPEKDEEFHLGETLEQQALDACRRNDVDDLTAIIGRWHDHLRRFERPARGSHHDSNPFRPIDQSRELPNDFLDVGLSNFIATNDGIEFVDREWIAGDSVDADLVRFRALWYFAVELVTTGTGQPFAPDATVNSVAIRLWELIGYSADASILELLFPAESELQHCVTGEEPGTAEGNLRQLGSLSRTEKEVADTLPVSQLRRDAVHLRALLDTERAQADEARAHLDRVEGELDLLKNGAESARAYQQKLESEIEDRRLTNGAANYVRQLENGLEDLRSAAEKALAYQRGLESELHQSHSESTRAAAHLQHMEAEVETMRKYIEDSKLYQLHLEAEIEQTRADSAEAAAHLHYLETTIDEMRANADESKQYQLHLESELQRMHSDSETTVAYLQQLETEIEDLRGNAEDSQRYQLRLEANLEQSELDSAAAREYQQRLEDEIKRLETQVVDTSRLQQELANERDRLAEHAATLESAAAESAALLDAANDRLSSSQSKIDLLERRLNQRLVRVALSIHRLFGGSGS